jgi:anti-sigma regulatory factor (Ser/Thr protein kinase)
LPLFASGNVKKIVQKYKSTKNKLTIFLLKIGVKIVVSFALPRTISNWKTLSFSSTLYLCPVLDLLLANIPEEWHAELRLGLQEALVNAAKHGNQLDPSKVVSVKYLSTNNEYYWIICDEGHGFSPQCNLNKILTDEPPSYDSECGRGLCILYQIFEEVHWNNRGNELRLCKQIGNGKRPLIS